MAPLPLSSIQDYQSSTDPLQDYQCKFAAGDPAFKCTLYQGRFHVVSSFPQGFKGVACERYESGETYVGQYEGAKRHGRGNMTGADRSVMFSKWFFNKPVNEGVQLSGDRKAAHRVFDGRRNDQVSLGEARVISQQVGFSNSTGVDDSMFAC